MERRGRPKLIENIEKPPRKFIRTYEDEFNTETWTYDLDIFPNGPIYVEIKRKYKTKNATSQNIS